MPTTAEVLRKLDETGHRGSLEVSSLRKLGSFKRQDVPSLWRGPGQRRYQGRRARSRFFSPGSRALRGSHQLTRVLDHVAVVPTGSELNGDRMVHAVSTPTWPAQRWRVAG